MIRELCLSLVLGTMLIVDSTSGIDSFLQVESSSIENKTIYADYRENCSTNLDCDLARNMFCDIGQGLCSCLPDTAFDSYGRDCRRISCYSYDNDKCPADFECVDGRCTKFCQINSYSCNTQPIIQRWNDKTYEIGTWVALGLTLAIVGLMLLTCLVKRCKRIQCKLVSTQHGRTILVAPEADKPLLGNESPTKVYSLCFCVPPTTTTTSYMQRCQCDSTNVRSQRPVVVAPEYKDLPPYYVVEHSLINTSEQVAQNHMA